MFSAFDFSSMKKSSHSVSLLSDNLTLDFLISEINSLNERLSKIAKDTIKVFRQYQCYSIDLNLSLI